MLFFFFLSFQRDYAQCKNKGVWDFSGVFPTAQTIPVPSCSVDLLVNSPAKGSVCFN